MLYDKARHILAVIFIAVGLGCAVWQTNQAWSISHDCQCGVAYGFAQGDYFWTQIPRTALMIIPVGVALYFHPLAGLIASILTLGYSGLVLVGFQQVSDNPSEQFWRSSTWLFILLNAVILLMTTVFLLSRRLGKSD